MGLEVITWVAIAALTASAGSTYMQMESAKEAKKAGKQQLAAKNRQTDIQTKQAQLQARLEAARTKRAQRVRSAQLTASMGSMGVTGSVFEAPLVAGESVTEGQLGTIGSQLDLQTDQYGVQREQYAAEYATTAANADAAIGSAIGSFASTALGAFASTAPGAAEEIE